ncbi:hypothetical protein [Bacillus massiliigorillae]|uniref:hypothetical protein n=1 Tax=Bacillus massiliigorillae TaxID=1243664 RepID=UPI00039DFAC1|nr:hypothetical protein [Bacillus massiliigorillae]
MKFLTFVEIDLRKIIPFLLGMFALAIIGFQGMFYKIASNANEDLVRGATESGVAMNEYLKTVDKMSLTSIIDQNPYPVLILIFVGLGLILFGFYLWYKEWFGASKRIYTLLSIKGSRFRIFTSKLVVFLFIFITYYGVILLNIFLSSFIVKMILPEQIIASNLVQNFILHSQILPFALPVSAASLLFNLAFIVMMFSILSVFVLWDRSKKIIGMIGGFIYIASTIAVFFYINTLELYTSERTLANWAFTITVLVLSSAISYYLLKKKVSI